MIKILHNLALFWVKNAIFRNFFGKNIFKIIDRSLVTLIGGQATCEAGSGDVYSCAALHCCQIFLGTKYQNGGKCTKLPQNTPKGHKILANGRKIDQTSIKYANIFHCKALQSLPKLRFLAWK
jgi:hypothetical protein